MRLEAVGKRYGLRQPWIVRDVTAAVAAGKLIRLEGPNGSGKSTLLRIAAGAMLPSAGRVRGRPAAGYVPERFPGGLTFPAREYLRHMARIHGLSGGAGPAAVDELLDRLGAADYADAPLRTLSKGMCQKVAIAQALLSKPGLLVLDEAWTGLDQAARGALDAAVTERLAAGGTVMFVDHEQARLRDRVDERWTLAGGTVAVLPGAPTADRAAVTGQVQVTQTGQVQVTQTGQVQVTQRGRGGPPMGTAVIELTGVEIGSLGQLGMLPGVLAVSPGPDPGADPRTRLDLVRVTATEPASDGLLRRLLGWDGVHVAGVRPGQERGP